MRGELIKPFTIAGTGKQVRDVLHADDLIRLYQQAYVKRNNIAGKVFNIGGGLENSLSLIELFSLLSTILDMPNLIYEKTPRRSSDQDCFIASINYAKESLSWTPEVSSENGIKRMLKWCQANSELLK